MENIELRKMQEKVYNSVLPVATQHKAIYDAYHAVGFSRSQSLEILCWQCFEYANRRGEGE